MKTFFLILRIIILSNFYSQNFYPLNPGVHHFVREYGVAKQDGWRRGGSVEAAGLYMSERADW